MKTTTWILTCFVICLMGVAAYYAPSMKPLPYLQYTVIKKSVSETGLISVQFTDGLDTAAYDYLTPHQYDQFLKHNDPYWDEEQHNTDF